MRTFANILLALAALCGLGIFALLALGTRHVTLVSVAIDIFYVTLVVGLLIPPYDD